MWNCSVIVLEGFKTSIIFYSELSTRLMVTVTATFSRFLSLLNSIQLKLNTSQLQRSQKFRTKVGSAYFCYAPAQMIR